MAKIKLDKTTAQEVAKFYVNSVDETIFRNFQIDQTDINGNDIKVPFDRSNKVLMENFLVFSEAATEKEEPLTLDLVLTNIEKSCLEKDDFNEKKYLAEVDRLMKSGRVCFYYRETDLEPCILRTSPLPDGDGLLVQSLDQSAALDVLGARRSAIKEYYNQRLETRKAEIADPKLFTEKASEQKAKERLGTEKEIFDDALNKIKPVLNGTNATFDRYNLETRDNFFTFIKDTYGKTVKQPLSLFLYEAEKLPPQEYKKKMTELFEQRNIFVNETGVALPTSWGYDKEELGITPEFRADKALFDTSDISVVVDDSNFHMTAKTNSRDSFKMRSNEDVERILNDQDLDINRDLPEQKKMPWYLSNGFTRAIAFFFSDNAKEEYRYINSINQAYENRQKINGILSKDVRENKENLIKQTKSFVARQSELFKKRNDIEDQKTHLKESNMQMSEKENQDIQADIAKDEKIVSTHKDELSRQARSLKNAGYRINNVFNENPSIKGLDECNINIENIPKSVRLETNPNGHKEFTAENQAFFNFANLITAPFSAQEGSKEHEALKNIVPQCKAVNQLPATLFARNLIEGVFAGKNDKAAADNIEPLIIHAKDAANKAITQFNNGNPKDMGKAINAGATVLLQVLNSTSPEDFNSQKSKWPIAAKCVKQLVDITEKFPEIATEYGMKKEMLDEMKGWAKISDAITKSSEAKSALTKGHLTTKEQKTKAWTDIYTEMRLRGLCANTYKANSAELIKAECNKKGVQADNLIGKEQVLQEKAQQNKEAKAICMLGQDNNLMDKIKASIDVDNQRLDASQIVNICWLCSHTEHNNGLSGVMVEGMVNKVEAEKQKEGIRQDEPNKAKSKEQKNI